MRGKKYIFLAGVSLALIAADQGSKWWAATTLAERVTERARPACNNDGPFERRVRYRGNTTMEVIPEYFTFRYVENCAGAFGILREQNENVRRPFFLVVSIAAVVFIVLLFQRLRPEQMLLMWALPFVLGGALGNLIDRIHLRYVIDFIDWAHPRLGHWPTFNIADAAIVVGVGLILLDMLPFGKSETTDESPARESVAAEKTPTEDEG